MAARPAQPAPRQVAPRPAPAAQVLPLRAAEHAELTMDRVAPRREPARSAAADEATLAALKAAQDANASMLGELRAMREMMKERFETIAFIEKLGRTPSQAALAQKLLDGGFSAVLPYLMPSVGQSIIDQQTASFYKKWKKRYVRKDPYYKKTVTRFVLYNQQHQTYQDVHSPVAVTVSEAQGYGMIITALMAGYDKDAKAYFDSMYRYYKRFKSNQHKGTYLMAWQQWDNGKQIYSKKNDRNSASDGDIDIAYALLLADRQWGSSGTYDYKSAALHLIHDIYKYEVNKDSYTIQYGDWVKWESPSSKYFTGTRTSDFILAEFSSFAQVDSQNNWDKVISSTYQVINSIRNRYSSKTGLLPDFLYRTNGKFYPEKPNAFESSLDGSYGYNACRVPWRIGTDYLVHPSPDAKEEVSLLNQWIRNKTGEDPSKIGDGYSLSGKLLSNYFELSFTAPFLVSAVCKEGSSQKWVDALWDKTINYPLTNYYNDTLKMLCILTAGGNWM